MPYLDPGDRNTTGEFHPKSPIPPALRAFGRYPNTDEWLPGDIILFSDTQPGLVSRMIQKVQADCGYAPAHAMWQHAAIYIGNEHLCEAVWPRIRVHPLFDAVQGRYICVRRMAQLSSEQRFGIAISCLTKLGGQYGWPELLRILVERGRMWRSRSTVNRRPISLICSQHCAAAYASVTGTVLSIHAGLERATTPADLALTTQLIDIPVCWRRIPS